MFDPYNASFCFLDELCHALDACQNIQSLAFYIEAQQSYFPDYRIHQGLVFYKGRIWIDRDLIFKKSLLQEFHNSPLIGIMGVE